MGVFYLTLSSRACACTSDTATRVQANDKEAFLHRFVSVECTLKEAITKQLDAAQSLDVKVALHNEQMQAHVLEMNGNVEGKEAVLREQLEVAMRKIRRYAREVEQTMESVRPRVSYVHGCQHVCGNLNQSQ
jgi:hypothetical protein